MTIIERARRYVSKMPEAISGQHGHNTMFSVACALVQGFSLDTANARILLAEYNTTLTEPFNEREVDHKLQGATKAQSTKGRGYLLNASDRTAKIRVTPKKPANTAPSIIQRVTFRTPRTGISYMDMKNNYKEDNKTIGESELGVLPVLTLEDDNKKTIEESEKGVLPVLRDEEEKTGKPTLSPTGVLRIPMNAPIQYRYWLEGTPLAPVGTKFLSPQETRDSLFRKSIPTKTGS